MIDYQTRNYLVFEEFNGLTYAQYLESPLWHAIRRTVLIREPNCRRCGKLATQVHHASYALDVLLGLWQQPLWSVCRKCHQLAEIGPEGSKCFDIEAVNRFLSVRPPAKTQPTRVHAPSDKKTQQHTALSTSS